MVLATINPTLPQPLPMKGGEIETQGIFKAVEENLYPEA